MMRIYQLSGMATARLWQDACPINAAITYRGYAVEVSIPRGAMCEYGLLGASPLDNARACSVSVPGDGRSWDGSLVEGVDEVSTGLPREFVDAVAQGGRQAVTDVRLTVGLDFNCACHGVIGSNAALFGRLAKAVVHLYADPSVLRDEARLLLMLEGLRVI